MEAFTLKQLNEICQTIIERSPREYPELCDLFTTLYTFGLRHIEAYQLNRWSFEDLKTIVIKTAKKGNPRKINVADVPRSIIEMVISKVEFWNLVRYDTARLYCQRFSPYPFAVCRNKEIGMHIFRHTYIKNLSDMGMNDEQIAELIGEVDAKNIGIYVKSDIFATF